MKYILIDNKEGDFFTEEFETLEEAIIQGEKEFSYLTEHDKKLRNAFYVLESVNPNEEAENHYDGNPVKIWI